MGKGLDPDGDESKADRQACSCRFCLRAIALWHLGYRRTGMSYREKKQARKERARDPRVRV